MSRHSGCPRCPEVQSVQNPLQILATIRRNLDKVMSMHSVSVMVENGFVHVPTQADWLAQYVHEMAVEDRSLSKRPQGVFTGEQIDALLSPLVMARWKYRHFAANEA